MDKRRSVCPPAVIRRLSNKGLIPQGEDRLISFEALKAILNDFWNDDWYVKRILKKFPANQRNMLIIDPCFNKVDRYIYKMFRDKKSDGQPLFVKDVAAIVKTYFKVDCSPAHIRSIRRKAYYFHEKQRGKNLSDEAS